MKTNPVTFFFILLTIAVSCSPSKNIYSEKKNGFILKNKIYADSTIMAAIGVTNFEQHITGLTNCAIIDIPSTSFYYKHGPDTQQIELVAIVENVNKITYYYNYNLGEPNYDILFTVEVEIDSLLKPSQINSTKLPYIKLIEENTPSIALQAIKTIAEKYQVKIKWIDIDLFNGELQWSITPRKKSDPIIFVDFYNMDKTITIPNDRSNK